MPKETRTVIEHAHPSSFPVLQNIRSSNFRLREGAEVRIEVNADCLPYALHPYPHFVLNQSGTMRSHVGCFIGPLHPSYVFGRKGQQDDILDRLGGVDNATRKASQAIARKGELLIEPCGFVYVQFTLRVGDHEMHGIMETFAALSHVIERCAPPARESAFRAKRTALEANLEADKGFRAPKRRKAG